MRTRNYGLSIKRGLRTVYIKTAWTTQRKHWSTRTNSVVWLILYACAQPYHSSIGSHGHLCRPSWGSSAWHNHRPYLLLPRRTFNQPFIKAHCQPWCNWVVCFYFEIALCKWRAQIGQHCCQPFSLKEKKNSQLWSCQRCVSPHLTNGRTVRL